MRSEIPALLRDQAQLQAGVVTRQQALKSGLSASAIIWKIRAGVWQQVHPGVYATFTGPPGRPALFWAAVLYAGKGALLSHETAAELNGLAGWQSGIIHVTIPANRRVVAPRGVKIHVSACLETGWRFPPGTPPHTLVHDTILDLANCADNLDDVVAWITAAFSKRLTGEAMLRSRIAGRKKLRWRGQVGEIIALAASGGVQSVLEFRYDRDVERAHGLPSAARQAPFTKPGGGRGFRDRYYEEYGLAVELDGERYHGGERRRHDRVRDNQAAARGGATLRYGWDDVARRACETAAQVYDSLRERGYRGALTPCSPGCRAFPGPRRRSA